MPEWKPLLEARLVSLRLSAAREREIIDELSQHLDDLYRERRTAGAPHDDAVRGALEELDERDLLAREMRTLNQVKHVPPPVPGARGGGWLTDVRLDVAYATRTLLNAKGWAAVIVLLLAIGIGANTALFSATNALLFSAIAVSKPGELVRLRWTGKNDAVTDRSEYGYVRPLPDGTRPGVTFSYDVFRDLAASTGDLADLFACAPLSPITTTVDGNADLATGLGASGNYFRVLGINAELGRVFTPDDDRADAPPVAVISHAFWQKKLGGDPAAVGKVIRVNDVPLAIIGVTSRGFSGVQQTLAEPPDISFPLSLDAQLKASTGRGSDTLLKEPTAWWLQVMGRLRPGGTVSSVQAKLDGVFRQKTRANLASFMQSLTDEQRASSRNRDRREVPSLLAEPGDRGLYDVVPDALSTARVLNAVVVVVLLIICANVANLMLSRATSRRKEIAVRLSLGATRGRLVRQLFTESLMLALVGGALGLAVAYYGVQLLPEPGSSVNIFDGPTLAFATFAAIVTSIVFGAVPALRATDVHVGAGLKETSRSIAGGRSVLSRALLIVQVALSLVLLVGAGLFLQTLQQLRRVDVGFDTSNLLVVRVTPRIIGYDLPRSLDLYGRLIERTAAVPGVRGVALSQPAPLSGSINSTDMYVGARAALPAPPDHEIYRMVMSPGFLDVMGIRIVHGRGLTDRDVQSTQRVAVINETAAKKFFGGDDPVGSRFGSVPDRASDVEIVGVVKDAKYASVRDEAPPTMYVSYRQFPRPAAFIEVRTAGSPAALIGSIRQAFREVDANLPIAEIKTQSENIERLLQRERVFAQAYALFGGIALLLAAVGLFGLMSYNVGRRTPEMGIRMALGAQRFDVVRLVMRESLLLVAIGLALGGAIAFVSVRLVKALLFSVPPHDVATFGLAVAVMVAVSAAAAYLPARRASRVDPIVALRYE